MVKTRTQLLQERNAAVASYRREAIAKIGSPFRLKLYTDARLAGKSEVDALAIAKRGPQR